MRIDVMATKSIKFVPLQCLCNVYNVSSCSVSAMFAMCPHEMFVLVQTQEEDVRLGAEMLSKASVELSDTFSPHHNALADNLDALVQF